MPAQTERCEEVFDSPASGYATYARSPRHREGEAVPKLKREPGWQGTFTRESAPGAIHAGRRVIKMAADETDQHKPSECGTVRTLPSGGRSGW